MSEWKPISEPRTPFQRLLRNLAEEAMAVTHHDISETEPEYANEVREMEKRFSRVLRSYNAHRPRSPAPESGGGDA